MRGTSLGLGTKHYFEGDCAPIEIQFIRSSEIQGREAFLRRILFSFTVFTSLRIVEY